MLASEVEQALQRYPNLTVGTLQRINELLAWLDARASAQGSIHSASGSSPTVSQQ